jgi:hypothetical protein
MKLSLFKSLRLWKDSAVLAFAFLASIESVMSITSISLDCIGKWWVRLALIVAVYAVLTIVILIVKYQRTKSKITLDIRGIKVTIERGDIFKADGWKLIPFNEYFDTTVDDIIISSTTLNGLFIKNYVDNLGNLEQEIAADDESRTLYKRSIRNERWVYPLGRIKTYKDYMLLAFTHFNEQNEAHINSSEFEHSLRIMWQEIRRTYSNKPVFLPLLGSGITTFDNVQKPSTFALLKCIVCTLSTSEVDINQPITILLTEDALQKTNLYDLKGVK